MEQDGLINFRALRAKFQEEAALAQAKNKRPTIAEKPRHLPPPPPVLFRSELRVSSGKRPISFPPQPTRCGHDDDDDDHRHHAATQKHLGLSLPLVLPPPPPRPPPMKGHPLHPAASTAKEHSQPMAPPVDTALPSTTTTIIKARKKGLLLPFRGGGDGQLSSPDVPVSPPSGDTTSGDSDSRLMSTLERAKKKLSRKHMLLYGKVKSLPSPDDTPSITTRVKAPYMKSKGGVEANFPFPPPVCLPHLACISARPFFKVDITSRKISLDKQLCRDRYGFPCGRSNRHSQPLPAPPSRSLPGLASLGPAPAKPPRPQCVDLCLYRLPTPNHQAPPVLTPPPVEDPAAPDHLTASSPVLDAPDFPDFDKSVSDAPDDEDDQPPIDLASLELEILDLVSFDLPPPANPEMSYFEAPLENESADSAGFDLQGLHLNVNPTRPNSKAEDFPSQESADLPEPPDPSCFPEPLAPESWCSLGLQDTAQDAADPPTVLEPGPAAAAAGGAHPGGPEAYSSTDETQQSGHAALANGVEAQPSATQQDGYYDACDNVYEDVENINRYLSSQNSQKPKEHKGSRKNPYAESHQANAEVRLNMWPRNPWGGMPAEHVCSAHPPFHRERLSPEHGEHKEQKKRERQRLEKERKEQKEREKRENEMKKKFKVTGVEKPLYHAKVMVASKVHKKHDLPVTSGDAVSIIRTTNCPKGRWLARNTAHKYGYISVMNVELNIKEMLELGKKAQAAGRGGNVDPDTVSIGSRSSNYPALTSSFTDDSEEWACEDEPSPSTEIHSFHQRTVSMPEMMSSHASAQHTLSDANMEDLHTQTRHEALQKLAIFFQHNKDDIENEASSTEVTPTNVDPPSFLCEVEEPAYLEQEVDFAHLELLPPPPFYADTF